MDDTPIFWETVRAQRYNPTEGYTWTSITGTISSSKTYTLIELFDAQHHAQETFSSRTTGLLVVGVVLPIIAIIILILGRIL